ncbi:hypothetical protein ANCCEY_00943 [Ancylostoma ceylanicum]|uniref:Uncharacterized protein n=1 Tax=Ancylostoma ceylanicum TaxID=53326 RepID=A0A0D6M765_9BILA|nr:hypothetical protein ANCCEY_00943 [Ancylostoma ceylanicum]
MDYRPGVLSGRQIYWCPDGQVRKKCPLSINVREIGLTFEFSKRNIPENRNEASETCHLPYCPSPSDSDENIYCCQFFTFGVVDEEFDILLLLILACHSDHKVDRTPINMVAR